MTSTLYIAWRYLAYHRVKTVILVLSIALIAFVPTGLRFLVAESERELTARADATPLLIGARGSPLELVLNSLYFAADVPETLPFGEVARVRATRLADPIPLYVRFRSRDTPIVGTTLDYFELRGLRVERGRQIARLGDCVVGATVARRRDVEPGGTLTSSPENVFDLAGVYPLQMRVVGVLAPAGTPDDEAIFVDVRTTWVIEGLGHGHDDLAQPEARAGVLKREDGLITANESVQQHTVITAENLESFHFHGSEATFPITAIVAVPPDHKSATLLRGRYETSDAARIVRPFTVVDELLGTIVTVQHLVIAALAGVGLATGATAVLVFMLSLRLRKREIETMVKIGGSRRRIAAILVSEIVTVLVASAVLSAVLTWTAVHFGSDLVRTLILES
ncbi:MAG: ABC transporter permease [Planctomycetes bacterium]|nr:ABC transporter permease [Planctomycetota bacterium]